MSWKLMLWRCASDAPWTIHGLWEPRADDGRTPLLKEHLSPNDATARAQQFFLDKPPKSNQRYKKRCDPELRAELARHWANCTAAALAPFWVSEFRHHGRFYSDDPERYYRDTLRLFHHHVPRCDDPHALLARNPYSNIPVECKLYLLGAEPRSPQGSAPNPGQGSAPNPGQGSAPNPGFASKPAPLSPALFAPPDDLFPPDSLVGKSKRPDSRHTPDSKRADSLRLLSPPDSKPTRAHSLRRRSPPDASPTRRRSPPATHPPSRRRSPLRAATDF
jgi:hypothetical protein